MRHLIWLLALFTVCGSAAMAQECSPQIRGDGNLTLAICGNLSEEQLRVLNEGLWQLQYYKEASPQEIAELVSQQTQDTPVGLFQ
jgi:hypothetical protein